MTTLPPRKIFTRNKVYRESSTPLELLLQLGFSKHRAEKGLAATGNRSVQLAFDWILEHINDSSLDEDWPREYILYACPTGSLSSQLAEFWKQSKAFCGWNSAHNYIPHISLTAFFKAADNCSLELSKALNQVSETVGPSEEEMIPLEPHISPDFMGLLVPEKHADYLKKIAEQYVNQVSAIVHLEPHTESLHLTLANQFPPSSFPGLKGLVDQLQPLQSDSWELRLYSRDPRFTTSNDKGFQVHAVQRPYTPQKGDELELRLGDLVFIKEEALQNSQDSWVPGTSWLTGNTGFLPTVYTERTAETDAWTLHRVASLTSNTEVKMDNTLNNASVDLSENQKPSIPPTLKDKLSDMSGLGAKNNEKAFSEWDQKMADLMNNIVEEHLDPKKHGESDSQTQGSVDLETNSTESKVNNCKVQTKKTVFTVRHGERVDFTFGNWRPFCFDKADNYTRQDLNMPAKLPNRAGGQESFELDCPLTRVGILQATLTGEGMKDLPGKWSVYSSPSLRCIETAAGFLDGLGQDDLKISIEPGLFEWCGWYPNKTPLFMTTQELLDAGFRVESNYKPYINFDNPIFTEKSESIEQFYIRSGELAQKMVAEADGVNVMFVGHSCTLDTCCRGLLGLAPRDGHTIGPVYRRIPYCSVIALTGPQWRFIQPPCPPMLHTSNGRFNWKILETD